MDECKICVRAKSSESDVVEKMCPEDKREKNNEWF